MPMEINEARKKVAEQVLEYWYTIDFLNQGALKTEETKRDREQYSYVMSNPHMFSVLMRKTQLNENDNILTLISNLQNKIDKKRNELYEDKKIRQVGEDCCHGNITVMVGRINRSFITAQIAGILNCEPPLNPSTDHLAWASFLITPEGKYIKGSFSLSPILWAVHNILHSESGKSMYEMLDHGAYLSACKEFDMPEETVLTTYNRIIEIADKIYSEYILSDNMNQEDADSRLRRSSKTQFPVM